MKRLILALAAIALSGAPLAAHDMWIEPTTFAPQAGDPSAGLAKGVEVNDKNFLDRFPFLAPAHNGLLQGHGGINTPPVPNIPNPAGAQP